MVPRFFAPSFGPDSRTVLLPPDEATHLTRVLRLAQGAKVRVFDGKGFERQAVVARTTKTVAELSLGDVVLAAPESRTRITLGQGLLKADKFDDVVRDATMLGVSAIRPLATARADVPAAALREGGRLERWHRIAVASVKQCGRAVVPDLLPVVDLAACLAADGSAVRVMLAEPSLGGSVLTVDEWRAGVLVGADAVLLLVGPEGGWAAEELTAGRAAGCHLVTLGRRTLRADAAPLVALSVLLHVLGDL